MENVRGRDVFLVQPTCPPSNDNLMELLLMTDAAAGIGEADHAVVPYFGYARQDRRPRATRVAIARAGGEHDCERGGRSAAHRRSARGSDPGILRHRVDNVYASPVLLGDAWKHKDDNMVVVSRRGRRGPRPGARQAPGRCGSGHHRQAPAAANESKVMNIMARSRADRAC